MNKPNTLEQVSRINAEIRKKSRRWIYYNALDNPVDSGWCRDRACDFGYLLDGSESCRHQLTPPRNINPLNKESLYYDPQRTLSNDRPAR